MLTRNRKKKHQKNPIVSWVGHSVMKPVDDVAFQKRKALREGNNEKSKNFEIDILDEGALDKVMEGPEKHQTGKNWRKIYEVIGDKYFK